MKILILHPDLQTHGGIENYFLLLKNKFEVPVKYFLIGKRFAEKGFWRKFFRFFVDYYSFIKLIRYEKFDLVVGNPSLDLKGIIRDGMFIIISKKFDIKTILFIHGWYKTFENQIEKFGSYLIKILFRNVDAFIVLSKNNEGKLKSWGILQPIFREVTFFDPETQNGFDINKAIKDRQKSQNLQILFLSRILIQKGIYETIEAFSILQKRYPLAKLFIAGDGEELENIKLIVRKQNISNVQFSGHIIGSDKTQAFNDSHLYCFPSYTEGFPLSIVEAMSFGLPVITTAVGGIPDFFENGVNGYLVAEKNPNSLVEHIKKIITDKKLYENISLNNYHYAQSHFAISSAIQRLEKIFHSVIKDS